MMLLWARVHCYWSGFQKRRFLAVQQRSLFSWGKWTAEQETGGSFLKLWAGVGMKKGLLLWQPQCTHKSGLAVSTCPARLLPFFWAILCLCTSDSWGQRHYVSRSFICLSVLTFKHLSPSCGCNISGTLGMNFNTTGTNVHLDTIMTCESYIQYLWTRSLKSPQHVKFTLERHERKMQLHRFAEASALW